jgi:Zn-dependent metalloprotease
MRIFTIFIALLLFVNYNKCRAQLDSTAIVDSLMNEFIDIHDSSGIWLYKPNKVVPGQLFSTYRSYFTEDTLNDFKIVRSFTNFTTDEDHFVYRQYFDGIPVEGANFQELVGSTGFVNWTSGKIADLSEKVGNRYLINKNQAWQEVEELLENNGDTNFVWMNNDWEQELKDTTGDLNATYHPLNNVFTQWSLINGEPNSYVIPDEAYKLCWVFEVTTLNPEKTTLYHVSRNDGSIVKVQNAMFSDGPIATLNHGTQSIDTRPKLGSHILFTNNNGRNIRTKEITSFIQTAGIPWSLTPDISDNDDNWGLNHINSTSAHWMLSESWDYFKTVYNTNGFDNQGRKIRLKANHNDQAVTSYTKGGTLTNYDIVVFAHRENGDYALSLDIAGHEFTHGIIMHSSGLLGIGESGVLNESFADIFGFCVEMFTEGGISDWTIGEDATSDTMFLRSFSNPKENYRHYTNAICSEDSLQLGQPDTYEGEFWEFGTCDGGGLHINTGVQNYWFFLMAEGGTGTNDLGDNYNVSGIGFTKTRQLTYNTMLTLPETATYLDARNHSVAIAAKMWGYCSTEYFECTKAWNAVGLGEVDSCDNLTGIEENAFVNSIVAYPNPTSTILNIKSDSEINGELNLFNLSGQLVLNQSMKGYSKQIELLMIPNGVYSLIIESKESRFESKIVVIH